MLLNIGIYFTIPTHSFSRDFSDAMASGTCVSKLLLSSLKDNHLEITESESENSRNHKFHRENIKRILRIEN